MDALLDVGIKIVLFIQSWRNWLEYPMKAISFLGAQEFFMLLGPILYWCIDANTGLRIGLVLTASGCFNHALKLAFHAPRPYWYDARVVGMASEESFGIPSGHSLNAMVIGGILARFWHRAWGWVIASALIFLIGFSRVYLGVHFPTDVLVGWLAGMAVLVLVWKLEPGIQAWIQARRPAIQALAVWIASLLLIMPSLVVHWSLVGWSIPQAWLDNARADIPGKEISPLTLSGVISSAGIFFGLALGAILLKKWGGFQTRGVWWKLGLRYLSGLAGILLLWYGLGAIFPRDETLLSFVLRYIRYAAVGLWVSALAPRLFQVCGLTQKTG